MSLTRHPRAARRASRRGPPLSFRIGRPLGAGPLARTWWIVLLRALAAAALGVVFMVWPHHAVRVMVMAFGAYVLLDGLLGLVLSAWPGALRAPYLAAVAALGNLVAGAAALFYPGKVAKVLVLVVGGWLVIRGLALFGEALADLRAHRREAAHFAGPRPAFGQVGALVDGAAAALFGVALLVTSSFGLLSLAWAFGVWAILHGLLMSLFAFDLRRAHRRRAAVGGVLS